MNGINIEGTEEGGAVTSLTFRSRLKWGSDTHIVVVGGIERLRATPMGVVKNGVLNDILLS